MEVAASLHRYDETTVEDSVQVKRNQVRKTRQTEAT
jgi:hypothetical protein